MTETIESMVEEAALTATSSSTHTGWIARLRSLQPELRGRDIAGGAADWDQLLTRPRPSRTRTAPPIPGCTCAVREPPPGRRPGMAGANAVRAIRWG